MAKKYLGLNDTAPDDLPLEYKLDMYIKYLEKEKKRIWRR